MRLTGKYRYLTFEDRKKIEAWHLLGDRPVDIAARLSVHHTTIYKELQRGATGALDANSAKGTAQSSPRGGCVRASSAEVNETGRTVAKNTRQRRAEERRAQHENDHTTPTLKMDELRTPLRAAL